MKNEELVKNEPEQRDGSVMKKTHLVFMLISQSEKYEAVRSRIWVQSSIISHSVRAVTLEAAEVNG